MALSDVKEAGTRETSRPAPRVQIPEWDQNYHGSSTTVISHVPPPRQPHPLKTKVHDKFDSTFPPHKRYFGRFSRKVFLAILLAMLLSTLALVIGLAAGLPHNSPRHPNSLPAKGKTHNGDMTYYAPGLGSCGISSSASENVVAISHSVFDAANVSGNPNNNPLCGRKIRVKKDGKSADVKVVDRCVSCKANDVDMSPVAFNKLADAGAGRVKVKWAWL